MKTLFDLILWSVIGADLRIIFRGLVHFKRRRRYDHLAVGGEGWGLWACPLHGQLEGLGSVVSSPSGVWGEAPAAHVLFVLWRMQWNALYDTNLCEIGNYALGLIKSIIGGSWLDEPQGQNIGDSSPQAPTKLRLCGQRVRESWNSLLRPMSNSMWRVVFDAR